MTTETKPEKKVEKEEPQSIRDMSKEEQRQMMEDMPPPEGYIKGPEEEPGGAEEQPEKTDKPEVKEAKKEEKKPEEKPAEKAPEKPEERDFFTRLETEMAKPEGKEDLKDFTQREKAYFYQMRRDRKSRQKAESDRDLALRALNKEKSKAPEKTVQEEAAEDSLKVLEGKDPQDFLTVEEVRSILKAQGKTKPEAKEEPARGGKAPSAAEVQYLKMCEKEAREKLKDDTHDFDAVMDLTGELLEGDAEALTEISERVQSGENPAVVVHDIIKRHKDFETLYPVAETRVKARLAAKAKPEQKKVEEPAKPAAPEKTPEEKAKEEEAARAQEKLEKNSERPKTTAHASSREGRPVGELTLEQYENMSDLEFAKLPKATREKALRDFGSAPNMGQ